MATLPPRLHLASNGLKPSLTAWLTMHPYRKRAKPVDVSAITPQWYRYHEHGTDVLLYWYAQVRQLGEHIGLWGAQVGMSPSRFVAEAVTWDIVVLVDTMAGDWLHGDGLVGVVYGDDAYPPLRQRLHFWTAPPYRHPRVTDRLVGHVLPLFFERYALLWGVTPVTRHGALRAIRRWGFVPVGCFPRSELDGDALVDGIISTLSRTPEGA